MQRKRLWLITQNFFNYQYWTRVCYVFSLSRAWFFYSSSSPYFLYVLSNCEFLDLRRHVTFQIFASVVEKNCQYVKRGHISARNCYYCSTFNYRARYKIMFPLSSRFSNWFRIISFIRNTLKTEKKENKMKFAPTMNKKNHQSCGRLFRRIMLRVLICFLRYEFSIYRALHIFYNILCYLLKW